MFRFLFGTWFGRLVTLLAAGGAAIWGIRRFLGLDQSGLDDWTPPPVEPAPAETASSTDVDASLLEILACPDDKQPVVKIGDKIVCTQCGKRYPVRDGIPVMLIDEAEEGPAPTEEEVVAARAALKGEQEEAGLGKNDGAGTSAQRQSSGDQDVESKGEQEK